MTVVTFNAVINGGGSTITIQDNVDIDQTYTLSIETLAAVIGSNIAISDNLVLAADKNLTMSGTGKITAPTIEASGTTGVILDFMEAKVGSSVVICQDAFKTKALGWQQGPNVAADLSGGTDSVTVDPSQGVGKVRISAMPAAGSVACTLTINIDVGTNMTRNGEYSRIFGTGSAGSTVR